MINFKKFIQGKKEYNNKTTAVRWSEANYKIDISFLRIPLGKLDILVPVHNKYGEIYWLRQSYRHSTSYLLNVSWP